MDVGIRRNRKLCDLSMVQGFVNVLYEGKDTDLKINSHKMFVIKIYLTVETLVYRMVLVCTK